MRAFTWTLLLSLPHIQALYNSPLPALTRFPKTWISIALCLDQTITPNNAKNHFRFDEAAYWATKLWHQVTTASVIITIVTNTTSETDPAVLRYKEAGALIRYHNLTSADDVKYGCVATAQVARMMAFQHSAVEDGDIMVTSDADCFPFNANVLDPLTDHPSVDAWVWQYFHARAKGETFPLSFVALKAKKWRELMGNKTKSEWDEVMHPGQNVWGLDQRINTRMLLENKVCSVPHVLTYQRCGLTPRFFNDSATCWHGTRINGHIGHGHRRASWIHLSYKLNVTQIRDQAQFFLKRNNILRNITATSANTTKV